MSTFRLHVAVLVIALSMTQGQNTLAQPVVSSVSPAAQVIDAPVDSDILITFATPLDPATVTASAFRVFGRWSGPAAGTITVENSNRTVRFDPSADLFAGEWITVSLSNGITDASGNPLASGYSWNFWTATRQGTLNLSKIGEQSIRETNEGQIVSYGAYAGDFDNDGWSDLMIPNENTNDVRVFLNNSGSFDLPFDTFGMAGATGRPSPNEGADFDNDGNIDVAVGALGSGNLTVFTGDGTGSFTSALYTSGVDIRGVCIADYDADGDDDILVTSRNTNDLHVLANDGSGVFSDGGSFATQGQSITSCAVADVNADGIPDAFVGSFSSKEISILLGDGQGAFVFSDKITTGGNTWMLATGDVNGDGNADVVSAGGQSNEFSIGYGDGSGGFSSTVSIASDGFLVAIDLGDVDGDGDLELAVSSISNGRWLLYENDGSGTYQIDPLPFNANDKGSCVIFHDRDNDGDLDMTTIDEGADVLLFFDNDSTVLSVEMTNFDVLTVDDNLTLFWATATEVNNFGFEIERASFGSTEWDVVGFVEGAGSTTSAQEYRFALSSMAAGRYRFRLRQLDFDGTATYSNELVVVIGSGESVTLSPAFPNPFTDSARFDVVLPRMQEAVITLLNPLGQTVKTVYSGYLSGLDRHRFEVDSNGLASGTYVLRVVSENHVAYTSIVLMR